MKVYPVFWRVEGRHCAVVGAGPVAAVRIAGLVQAGARVRVVAPTVGPEVSRLIDDQVIDEVRQRPFTPADLDDCMLVIAATDVPEVNQAVSKAAAQRGIPCNRADAAEEGDLVVPATMRRGDLVIAVSTGGASPVVATDIRTRLEGTFGPEWGDLLALLARVRHDLKRRHPNPAQRAARVRALLASDVPDMLAQGRARDAEQAAQRILELDQGTPCTSQS